jgi:hypothetical protein
VKVPESQNKRVALRRGVRVEAAAWGAFSALNAAFVGPLLVGRGASPLELGLYSGGVNLFGLGLAWLGPWLAARVGGVARTTHLALLVARSAFVAVPLLLVATLDGAVPALIAALLVAAAGEGVALPLWTAFVAGVADPAGRGPWLAWRATVSARAAAAALVPMLALLSLWPAGRALAAAFAIAAAAGLVGAAQVRRLLRIAPPPVVPLVRSPPRPLGGPERRFLGGVFCFWFGAALNRPVLPPHLVHELHASAAYFAAAGTVAAVTGALVQPWWGRHADANGARAVFRLSGFGAGAVPLLWAVVPVAWLGLPVEAVAAGCWLGHLLGLSLRAVALAGDEGPPAGAIARVHLAQGAAAALAPLLAAVAVGSVGTVPILVASGLICLGATGIIAGDPRPAWRATPGHTRRNWLAARRGQDHRADAHDHDWPRPGIWARDLDAAAKSRVRARLPLALRQALTIDCSSCRGLGCRTCYGSGLG